VTLAATPQVLLLDEATSGLDYPAKSSLAALLRELSDRGTAVLLASHDVEFVAEYADRVVLLADGEVIADGPVREVITSSPVFAPQVAKIFAPRPLLTVSDVERALRVGG
jgi:energy-coupling factor transporter ATP-binding protein EcfA2